MKYRIKNYTGMAHNEWTLKEKGEEVSIVWKPEKEGGLLSTEMRVSTDRLEPITH